MGQTQSSSNDSTSPSTVDQSCPPTHDPYNVDPQGPYEKNGPMGGAGSPDFPPSDGYRWRKYGQKSVKGSAFARNYYKCTYPGCTVKKQVEKMTSNGKLVDHVSYKGDHTHDPPQITRLNAPDQQTFRNSVITESLAHTEHISKHDEDRGVPHHQPLALMPPPSVYEGMHHVPPALYNPHQPHQPHQAHQSHQHSPHQQHQVQSHQSHQPHPHQPHQSHSHQPEKDVHHLPPHQPPLPSPYAPVHSHQMVPYSPPSLHPVPPPPPPTSSAASPRLVIETNTDVDHLDDGYHWRKYGQKTVKGSPYPRSYYKCTEKGCSVKKQVEQNGTSIVNTYEGTHTHLAPGLDETTSDGKRRRPRRTKDSLELAVVPKKRMPDEILEREQDNGEHRLMPFDQQKRIRMQSMVDEITNHERSGNPSALDVSHQSHLHSNGAPVLPLTINRQLMEPVPSSSLLNLHQQMGHHSGLPNYYQPPAIYPPASHHTPQLHTPQGGRLSHSIELMGGPLHHHDQHHPSQHHHDQLHHDHHDQHDHHDHHQLHPVDHHQHQHHHDHHPDMFTPFTLPPPTLPPRNHTNL